MPQRDLGISSGRRTAPASGTRKRQMVESKQQREGRAGRGYRVDLDQKNHVQTM